LTQMGGAVESLHFFPHSRVPAVAIHFACPNCKTTYTVNDRDAGNKWDCKTCGQRLEVPKPPVRLKTVLGDYIAAEGPPPESSPAPEAVPRPVPPTRDEEPARNDEAGDRYEAPPPRPGKVQAIAFMLILGGAWAVFWVLGWAFLSGCLCLAWPGTYYSIVFAIMAVIRGAELMGSGSEARRSPRTILIMQVVCAVSADPANVVCGILGMVFLNDPALDRYFARGSRDD
jgi:hypothetical protein